MIPLTFAHNYKAGKGKWGFRSVAVYCKPADEVAKQILAEKA